MTIRVLVVDDSATMRHLITAQLQSDPDIEVVGGVANPNEARAAIKELEPDVMTLDVEMPGMNGIDFLEKVMRLRPMPVVMVSTLTQNGAAISMQALEIGAFDYVGKPQSFSGGVFPELLEKVRAAAIAAPAIRRRHRATTPPPRQDLPYRSDGRLVAIGASTGGVETLIEILSAFPANCPPTVITQHMPEHFTNRFAKRLDGLCAATVEEASQGAPIRPGMIYIAPGGKSHLTVAGSVNRICQLVETDLVSGHRPSVNVLFNSVVKVARGQSVGVILTGMGRDGAEGLLAMRNAGASTLGQDEGSSVVYGMPRVAHEIGAVERQLHSAKMAAGILSLTNQIRSGT